MANQAIVGQYQEVKEFPGVKYHGYTALAVLDSKFRYHGALVGDIADKFEVSCGANLLPDGTSEIAVYGQMFDTSEVLYMTMFVSGWLACRKFYEEDIIPDIEENGRSWDDEEDFEEDED